jgi:hypothetical protein
LNAGFFQTANSDDILFVGTTTSAGYFTNFGRTRRRGLELGVSGAGGPLEWRAAYSFIRAEFRSSTCVVSENNSSRGTSPEFSPEEPVRQHRPVPDRFRHMDPRNLLCPRDPACRMDRSTPPIFSLITCIEDCLGPA